ncbi:phosphatidylinositol 4-phosphate 3-kinase C2 domain-containing subunit alpha-like isoform X2 [Mytilus edulis]|uniref:phosphatidylinositol 4-phosphate 3-kinase C2 domain-containing subunit alpha-like isoform X2 n=1 Tax=Mytilus edulis TaxID=6550 RepID=UPI0039EF3484
MAFTSSQGMDGKSLNYQQRGTNNSPVPQLNPPPPIPQRSRRSDPPSMGWNIPDFSDTRTNSTVDQNFLNPASDPFGDSFQNNFTGNFSMQNNASSSGTSIPRNNSPLQLTMPNPNPNPTSKDRDSLIALSPDQPTVTHQKQFSHTKYSMDLQGLSFDNSGSNENVNKISSSSSSENLSSNPNNPAYPDISHAFREVRREPSRTDFGARLPTPWQTSGQTGSYGWNQELFNPNFNNASNDPWAVNSATNMTNVTTSGPPLPPRKSLSNVPNIYPTNLQIGHGLVQVLPMHPPAPNLQQTGNQAVMAGKFQHQFSQPHPYNPTPNISSTINANRPSSMHGTDAWLTHRLNVPQAGIHRTASASEFDNIRGDKKQTDSDVFQDNFHNRDFVDDALPRSRKGSDLIELSDEERDEVEKEYLSLESFDPLYRRQRSESVCSREGVLAGSPKGGFPSFVFAEATEVQPVHRGNKDSGYSSSLYPQIPDEDEEKGVCPMASHDELEMFLKSAIPVVETEQEAPPRPPPPKSQDKSFERLRQHMFVDDESNAFCQMVVELKSRYKSTDTKTNLGFIVSPLCTKQQCSMSVKIIVYSDFVTEPIVFTCEVENQTEMVISHVLYSSLGASQKDLNTSDFLLKVYDRSEYLLNKFPLCRYEYVHNCLKLDEDIKFTLMRRQEVLLPFLRTIDDDSQCLYFPKDYVKTDEMIASKEQMEILLNAFYVEVEKLRDHILKNETALIRSQQLSQAVKAICLTLCKIETMDITKTLQRVENIVAQLTSQEGQVMSKDTEDYATQQAIGMAIKCSLIEEMEEALEQLLKAVKEFIRMYCITFHTDFLIGSTVKADWGSKSVTTVEDNFILHIATVHRIPPYWSTKYDEYKVVCSLYYANKKIELDRMTSFKAINNTGLCDRILWDEWINFEKVILMALPRETRLCLTLYGQKSVATGNNSPANATDKLQTVLGGVTIQLYSQKEELIRGSHLVPLRMHAAADPLLPIGSVIQNDTVLMQINFPDFGCHVEFPTVMTSKISQKKSFNSLLPEIQEVIKAVMEKDCISSCQADELGILWQYRHYLYDYSNLLPWILQGQINWDFSHLSEIYDLLGLWKKLDPMQSLELLLPQYSDTHVREFACRCLQDMPTDELIDFLPQLIQALKFESYHGSALAKLLLEQACKSIRFAHQLFWLLKGAAQDQGYKRRYELMFVALVSVAGDALYQEFKKQEEMVKCLTQTSEKVQVSKDKDNTLKRELQTVYELFHDKGDVLMPYNPGISVCGLDLKSCSYFNSNAVPLKLVFKNSKEHADPVYSMFKVGDDLRQDMLTLQMIRIMDRLWLKQGLDLKMITFSCLATGPKKGMVEIVTESDTLRKIQVSSGVTGSFKDRPIKEWLQKHNPTELEYQKAVENFTRSCAGYCVATYVLGICDRHNDNIMLKQSGHMFHIDFNKFLGDAQMFGNIKRDRVPFVLTSDMAYVINNGEKQNNKFQEFVDMCCQAFNILRKNTNLFLNLFALLSKSGIPGIHKDAARYIQRVLLPSQTSVQASAIFTRMIEESLKSVFVQFNFFIHNLAQLKFSSHQEGALLSFVPKTYSLNTDGKISKVEVHSYQKRYTPERHYIFILRVERDNQKVPSYVFRHFSEFVEFRNKLMEMFPLIPWPHLSSKVIWGRSHIKAVAEIRKKEIENFLQDLWTKTAEISESDIVYTFFHPLLRDEQEAQKENLGIQKFRESQVQLVPQGSPFGQVKLSLEYKKSTLMIMVMHAKDLPGGSTLPSPYVKIYLLPDPDKQTKRKTKIVKDSTHPTYNEVIEYKMSDNDMRMKTLQVSVWDHDRLGENNLIGAVYIKLRNINLEGDNVQWYNLDRIQITDASMLA